MLAVKSSLAAQDRIPLLVFDEIDANVGGEIAHAVGAKMRSLGAGASGACASPICPQVAAAAHRAIRGQQAILGRSNDFGVDRGDRPSARGGDRANARRKNRFRAGACKDVAGISVEAPP